jgi:16S rRNA (cytidine1402-2'-O)-methyltransferase
VVAVEDSRVTAGLFRHLGSKGKMLPYHDHNADAVRPGLIARMASGSGRLV